MKQIIMAPHGQVYLLHSHMVGGWFQLHCVCAAYFVL